MNRFIQFVKWCAWWRRRAPLNDFARVGDLVDVRGFDDPARDGRYLVIAHTSDGGFMVKRCEDEHYIGPGERLSIIPARNAPFNLTDKELAEFPRATGKSPAGLKRCGHYHKAVDYDEIEKEHQAAMLEALREEVDKDLLRRMFDASKRDGV